MRSTFQRIKLGWEREKNSWRFRFGPPVVDKLISLSTFVARRELKSEAKLRILVDNNVLGFGITHETAWMDTGVKDWCGTQVETGYTARIPVYDDEDSRSVARNVRYLAQIAQLARDEQISLYDSSELKDERLSQPVGRFRGYGICDYNIFKGVELQTLHDGDYTVTLGPTWSNTRTVVQQRKDRLERKTDPLFQSLLSILGQKNSQDAYHISVAEKHECFCFLTMDFRLIKSMLSQRNNPIILKLKTKVISPEEFGKLFSINPLPTRLLSYHQASYPVEAHLNWQDSKRQPSRKKKNDDTG